MLFKWSNEVTDMLKQLEQTMEDEIKNNQDGIKISEIDFTDLAGETVSQAAPTIQFSVSTIRKDEIEEPVRRNNKCKNIV